MSRSLLRRFARATAVPAACAMLAALGATACAAEAARDRATREVDARGADPRWQVLAPIPDPVGLGGMFAGVLRGQLVAGGGSQFRDKPNWLQGEKTYSDRIFVLAAPDAKWTQHPTRMPRAMGHFATAATKDAIYLIGGFDANGTLAQAWRLHAEGNDFRFNAMPDFPRRIGYATASIVEGRIYVSGGLPELASKSPSRETWSLAFAATDPAPTNSSWRREPDFPGTPAFVSAAASDAQGAYVFGGISFDAQGKAIPSAEAHRFDTKKRQWTKLAPLPEPRVSATTPAAAVDSNRLLLIGGYAEVFPGPAREHPGFSTQTLIYDIARNAWSPGPRLPNAPVVQRDSPSDPGPAPMIAAPCVVWQNRAVLISGEVRASVRTPTVLAWPLDATPR